MRTLPSDFNGFRLANSKFGFVITLKGLVVAIRFRDGVLALCQCSDLALEFAALELLAAVSSLLNFRHS